MKLFKSDNQQNYSTAELEKFNFTAFANLPRAYKSPEKKDLNLDAYQKRLSNFRRLPVRQLEDAKNILSNLNRLSLKPDKRLELLNLVLKEIYPNIAIWYEKYQSRQNSLPEGEERREALTACIDAVEQIAIAYKHLFSAVFRPEARRYKKNRQQIYEYGFRILEMLLIEQRLRALRYQKLSRNAWQESNHVFFALALHNDLDEQRPLHGFVGIKKREKHHGPGTVLESNARRLYLSLQLFGLLDVTSWPTHLFHVPHAYIDSLNPGIKVTGDDGQPLREGCLLTWLDNDGPPKFERPDKVKGPSIQLDYTQYYNRLAKDYESIASMKFIGTYDPKNLSRPLYRLKEEDRVPVLQMMLTSLRKRQRNTRRHALFNDNVVRVYFGLGEVLKLLTDLRRKDSEYVMQSRQFTDSLAQYSSLLAMGEKRNVSTQWQILNFSAGGILISTMETDFSTPVALGQLIAFVPADEVSEPSLGFVCRLNRPQDQMVEVGINRLANYVEVLLVEGIGNTDEKGYIPAMLIQDRADNWQLVTQPRDDLKPGLPIKLLRAGTKAPARLGDVYLTKKEFTIFDLRSPGLQKQIWQQAKTR
jgi:hypothetical protein